MSDTGFRETSPLEEAFRQADALIRASLRGEPAVWPENGDAAFAQAVLKRCAVHGIAALVYQRVASASGWPREVLEGLRNRSAAAAIWELNHQRYLSSLLPELDSHGIEPVLLKGTALAYTCYSEPAHRMRGDTDLLISPNSRDKADSLLNKHGFKPLILTSGELVSYQVPYSLRDQLGISHQIDLHWRICNGQVLAKIFSHAELRARAVPASRLCGAAWVPSRPDAILIACMHRMTHRYAPYWVEGVVQFSADRLIWFYDLHLLAENLTLEEQDLLVRLAHEKGLAGICQDGLAQTADMLQTDLPEGLLDALSPGNRREMPRMYLDAGWLRSEFLNFKATPGVGPKLRFVRERVFPPGDYMRARFAKVRPNWLPWLYVRRMVKGAAGRLVGRLGRRAGGPDT